MNYHVISGGYFPSLHPGSVLCTGLSTSRGCGSFRDSQEDHKLVQGFSQHQMWLQMRHKEGFFISYFALSRYDNLKCFYLFFSSTPIAKGGMKTIVKNGLRTNVRLSHPNNVDFAPKRSVKTSQSCSAPPNRFATLGQGDIANERQNVSAKLSR